MRFFLSCFSSQCPECNYHNPTITKALVDFTQEQQILRMHQNAMNTMNTIQIISDSDDSDIEIDEPGTPPERSEQVPNVQQVQQDGHNRHYGQEQPEQHQEQEGEIEASEAPHVEDFIISDAETEAIEDFDPSSTI